MHRTAALQFHTGFHTSALSSHAVGTRLAVQFGSPLIGPGLLYEEKSKTIAPGPSLILQ